MNQMIAHTGPVKTVDPVAKDVLQRERMEDMTHVMSVMPAGQRRIVPVQLLVANVVHDVLLAHRNGLGAGQAFEASLASFGVEHTSLVKDSSREQVVEVLARTAQAIVERAASRAAEGLPAPVVNTDTVMWEAVLDILTARFGQRVEVTGWLAGQPTACFDTDGRLRPVRLTGQACPQCHKNPVVTSHRGTHERCLNQSQCGWRA